MNKKQIKMLVRIITAAVLMIALTVLAKFVTLNRWAGIHSVHGSVSGNRI